MFVSAVRGLCDSFAGRELGSRSGFCGVGMAARRSLSLSARGAVFGSICALRSGLFLFTAAAHGRCCQASSGEGEQAQASVDGDAGGRIKKAVRTIERLFIHAILTASNFPSCKTLTGVITYHIRIAAQECVVLCLHYQNEMCTRQ